MRSSHSSARTGPARPRFFNAISRLQKLTAGTVRFAGKDVTQSLDGEHRPSGHGPHLPEPAHLRQHDRARERPRRLPPARALGTLGRRLSVCRISAEKRRRSRERAMQALASVGLADAGASARRQSALRVAASGGDRPRSGVRAPPAPARRAGGRHERLRARRPGRAHPQHPAPPASPCFSSSTTSSWSWASPSRSTCSTTGG